MNQVSFFRYGRGVVRFVRIFAAGLRGGRKYV